EGLESSAIDHPSSKRPMPEIVPGIRRILMVPSLQRLPTGTNHGAARFYQTPRGEGEMKPGSLTLMSLTLMAALLGCPSLSAAPPRPAWTTSRLQGSPDP